MANWNLKKVERTSQTLGLSGCIESLPANMALNSPVTNMFGRPLSERVTLKSSELLTAGAHKDWSHMAKIKYLYPCLKAS